MMSLMVLGIFLVTMLMGVPIAVAMGVAAAAVIGYNDMPLAVVAQRTINALDSVPLLAVPAFLVLRRARRHAADGEAPKRV